MSIYSRFEEINQEIARLIKERDEIILRNKPENYYLDFEVEPGTIQKIDHRYVDVDNKVFVIPLLIRFYSSSGQELKPVDIISDHEVSRIIDKVKSTIYMKVK